MWLLLTYQVPARSAALLQMIRRKLTAAGAVYLSAACAAVPYSTSAERITLGLRTQIAEAGGRAALLRAQALTGAAEIAAVFTTIREREYDDITGSSKDAAAALATADPGYAQLWQHEAQLKRLTARHAAAKGHEVLGAGNAGAAADALGRYRDALDGYARRVYAGGSGA